MKSTGPNYTSNPVLNGGLNLGPAGSTITVALADSPGDAQPEPALNGTISGAGALTLANNATPPAGIAMANQADYGTLLITGASTYTGGTNINFGKLVVTNGSALGTGTVNIAQVATSGGTLSLGNTNYTNGTVAGGAITIANNINLGGAISGDYGFGLTNNNGANTLSGTVTLTTANATINAGGGSLTISNGIKQATGVTGALTVAGSGGTVILAGNNTYTGATTINGGGLLQVGNGGALAGGVVTASSVLGATSGIINNGGTNGGLTLDYSNNISLDAGTLTGTGGRITQAGPGTLTLTGTGSQGGYSVSTGTLSVGTGAVLTGTNYTSIGVNSGDHGTLNVSGSGILKVAAAPEPSQGAAFGLGLLGLAGLGLKARRRGPAA